MESTSLGGDWVSERAGWVSERARSAVAASWVTLSGRDMVSSSETLSGSEVTEPAE